MIGQTNEHQLQLYILDISYKLWKSGNNSNLYISSCNLYLSVCLFVCLFVRSKLRNPLIDLPQSLIGAFGRTTGMFSAFGFKILSWVGRRLKRKFSFPKNRLSAGKRRKTTVVKTIFQNFVFLPGKIVQVRVNGGSNEYPGQRWVPKAMSLAKSCACIMSKKMFPATLMWIQTSLKHGLFWNHN